MTLIERLRAAGAWVRARLAEPSTLAGIGAAATAAAAVSYPLNLVVFACSLGAVVMKEGGSGG